MVSRSQKSTSGHDYTSINFYDCIADYFKSTTLDTDNLLRCEFCNKANRSSIQYRMKTCKYKLTLALICSLS